MDLEIIIQSEVSRKEKSKYHILMHICGIWKNWYRQSYLQSRNRDTDVEVATMVATSHIWLLSTWNLCIPKEERRDGMNWEIGIHTYKLLILYIIYIANENPLYSTENTTLCSVVTYTGKKSKNGGIYVYTELIHFAVQ